MKYTTIDRVLAKLSRELDITELSETDLIEMIGEALDGIMGDNPHLGTNEEAVAFIEVKNHKAELPNYLKYIIQVARNNDWDSTQSNCSLPCTPKNIQEELPCDCNEVPTVGPCDVCHPCYPVVLDCNGSPITDHEIAYYRPYFDLQYEYYGWCNSNRYKEHFSPIRLANNTFFNSIVCKETDEVLYKNCRDEYSISPSTNQLTLSFQEGQIAVAYVRQALDEQSGYPLIPDNYSYLQAITSYVKMKVAQRMEWSGREGYSRLAKKAEMDWHWYCKQAYQAELIPSSIDELQDLADSRNYLIPTQNHYNNFFKSLSHKRK